VAVSLNLLNGFTGLFSLGHAGFMLVGAFTYSVFTIPVAQKGLVYQYFDPTIKFSIPEVFQYALGGPGWLLGVFICLIMAGILTAAIGFFVGLPVLRLKGHYLSIATLGFAEIIRAIFLWRGLGPITNGSNPMRLYARALNFTVTIGDNRFSLSVLFLMAISALSIFVILLLVNSSYGRAFKAIREDEIAAEAMGINLYKHKQISFCTSCFFTGVGGALLAIFMGSIEAENFRVAMSYEVLLIVVLGGIGSISGSVIGAFLFVFSSQWWLRGLDMGTFLGIHLPDIFRGGFRLVVFSVIILIVILFFRKGIMGDKELPYMINHWKKKISALISRKSKAGTENV
jgi:branched-chain amino acid transport system permease protein